MSTYRAWCPSDEEEADGNDIDAHHSAFAAEQYAEQVYERSGEIFKDIEVHVRVGPDRVAQYVVTVDWDPTFSAACSTTCCAHGEEHA